MELGDKIPVLLVEGLGEHDPQQVQDLDVVRTPHAALSGGHLLPTRQGYRRRQFDLKLENVIRNFDLSLATSVPDP
jgi:hypothetical protein